MARIGGSYLQQRRGQWLVQMAVPKDLRARVIGQNGRPLRKIERYLLTSDPKEAERRKHAVIDEIRATFDRLRSELPIPDAELERVGAAEELRVYNLLDTEHQRYQDTLDKHGLAIRKERIFGDDTANEFTPGKVTISTYASSLLRQRGYPTDAQSVDRVADALLKAQQSAITRIEKGMRPPAAAGHGAQGGTAPRISELVKPYFAHPDVKLSAITVQQCRLTYRLFQDHTRDAPLDAITRRAVAEFKDKLARLHRDYGRHKESAKLTLTELLARFPADGRGLGAKTINRHLSALAALWKWARREGHLADDAVSPFADQARKVTAATEAPISVDDMNKLFAGLAFDSPLPWCMAISAFSGMRAAEIANLDAAEVKRSPGGVWFFDLTRRAVAAGNDASVKSPSGRRVVPVHRVLVKLGLLKYVETIGKGPLFPALRPRRDGSRGHALVKLFGRHAEKRKVDSGFHGFRRSFVAALDEAGIDPDRKAYVIGHARSWSSSTYNKPGLAADAVTDVIAAVAYAGLKLSR